MKRLLHRSAGRRTFGLGAPLTVTLLLAAGAARAQTPYTGAGWIIGVPVPGIWCTNAQAQVGMRGNAHLVRVQCSDPRVTGRRTVFVNGAARADGSALIYGAAYQEVGTWDATGTNFTATGGMWETSHRGTMGADGSLNLHVVGYGWGGAIDGLRVDETLTRAPGPILDPTIPYNYTGTLKPPPLSTNWVLDDFNGPATSGSCYPGWVCYGPTTPPAHRRRARTRAAITHSTVNWGSHRPFTLEKSSLFTWRSMHASNSSLVILKYSR